MPTEEMTHSGAAHVRDDADHLRDAGIAPIRILRPTFVLLAVAAALIAIAGVVQLLSNHTGGASLRNYFYADATLQALAYGCVATGFFVSWTCSARSRVTREFSFSFMLAFVGAACIATQWVCTLIVYVLDYTTTTPQTYAQKAAEVRHLVDASALLQITGWAAFAGAILVSLFVLVARSKRSLPASPPQMWFR
jgi:hypothetical protein